MTATQQTVALFSGVAAVLVVASVVGYILHWRFNARGPNPTIDNLNSRIKAWWLLVALLGVAFAFRRAGVIVLFALASLATLREFITLTPTRRGDHVALAVAFFVVLPLQYYLIWIDWYGLYSVFIPVYVFLLLAAIAALRQDTKHFMSRVAETQWGLMISVFCLSHVPALLGLKIPGYEGRNLLLIAFLILVVQSSDVLQYIWGKLLGRHKIAPELSPSKTVEGFVGGVASSHAARFVLMVDHAVFAVAGGCDRAVDQPDGIFRRTRHVGDQARSWRQGLGLDDRRAWWRARSA